MTIDSAFVASIRSGPMDDDELRASLQNAGWDANLPAIRDERGTVLVGNRRMRIAAELGIEPVVATVAFGDDEEGRARLTWVSNIGSASLTPADRKRVAARLYLSENMTQAAIAKTLGVDQRTISRDLEGLGTVPNPPTLLNVHGRPRGGRPRGSGTGQRAAPPGPTRATRAQAAPEPTPEPPEPAPEPTPRPTAPRAARATPILDRAREIVRPLIAAGQPTPARPLGVQHGISHVHFETAIAVERVRLETLQTEIPTIDPATLSMTAQQRLAAAIRQAEQRIEAEVTQRLRAESRERLDALLTDYRRKERHYNLIIARHRGLISRADFRLIWSCLHADSRHSASDEKLNRAFNIWAGLEQVILSTADSGVTFSDIPTTAAGMEQRRQQVQEERRAARAARRPS
jgi:hypothetical protein